MPTAEIDMAQNPTKESSSDDDDMEVSGDEPNENEDNDSLHSDTTYDEINDEEDDDNDDDSVHDDSKPASGMADVISKLLKKSVPKNKNPILCKATTEKEMVERKRKRGKSTEPQFVEVKAEPEEVENVDRLSGSDADVDDDDVDDDDVDDDDVDDDDENERKKKKVKALTLSEQQQKKKAWEEMGRVKPSPLDRETERSLQRIATKGVIQLFNAVKKQQTINEEKTKDSSGLSAKAKCGKFLDMLKTKNKKEVKKEEIKDEADDSTWSILRDDFMMGSTMKDWDKDLDS